MTNFTEMDSDNFLKLVMGLERNRDYKEKCIAYFLRIIQEVGKETIRFLKQKQQEEP